MFRKLYLMVSVPVLALLRLLHLGVPCALARHTKDACRQARRLQQQAGDWCNTQGEDQGMFKGWQQGCGAVQRNACLGGCP